MVAKRSALLVMNMTNSFLFREYGKEVVLERAQKMIPAIRALQEEFISMDLPVIYLNDSHLPTDYEIKDWGPHSMERETETHIADGLKTDNLFILGREWKDWDLDRLQGKELMFEVKKGTYSGFTDSGGQPTALHSLLKKLGVKPGDTLYFTGIHTNGGIKHTAADAYFRGFHPVIVSDCTDSFDDPNGNLGMNHSQALEYAKYWYRAGIMLSGEVSELLGSLVSSGIA
jgi:nicotinamidase-related amidase